MLPNDQQPRGATEQGTGDRLGRLQSIQSIGNSFDSEPDLDSLSDYQLLSDDGDLEGELEPEVLSRLRSEEACMDSAAGEGADGESVDRLDYKSIRRRSIAIEQFKQNREAGLLLSLWNVDIQHRERKADCDDDNELLLVDFPRRRAVSFSGRVATSELHHRMAMKNDDPGNFRRYRRGSRNDQIFETDVENWKEKRRHSGPPDRSDFEESLAAYRDRERRRRSSYRLQACEQDFSGTGLKCVFVTVVILSALGAVMLLSSWLKKRL